MSSFCGCSNHAGWVGATCPLSQAPTCRPSGPAPPLRKQAGRSTREAAAGRMDGAVSHGQCHGQAGSQATR